VRARPDCHGARHAPGRRGRASGLQGRTDAEEALRQRVLAARGPPRLVDELRLCLVTDRTQTRDRDLIAVVGECLAAGLPAVQVREKDLPAAEIARLCRSLRPLTAARGALLIVNDRVDIALAAGADGVQRTSTSLSVEDMRSAADKRVRIGASVHSLDEAVAAGNAGAEWLFFG